MTGAKYCIDKQHSIYVFFCSQFIPQHLNKKDFANSKHQTSSSYYNSSSVCLFVPYFLRGPLTDLRQTWWVYVG